jgi:ankyrin repeat protein
MHLGNSLNPELFTSPLSLAVKNNNTKLIKYLLEHGVDINDIRALWFAVANDNYDFLQEYIMIYKNLSMINKGLFLVVDRNNVKMAEFLLKNGCDPNYEPKLYKRPVFYIKSVDMFLVFKKFAVNYGVKNEKDDDVLLNAVKNRYDTALINFYVNKLCMNNSLTKIYLTEVLSKGTADAVFDASVIEIFDLNMVGHNGIGFKNENVVRMLLSNRPILDKYIKAIGNGIKSQTTFCNVCKKNVERMTIIHIVIKYSDCDTLEYVLSRIANEQIVNIGDNCGRTPLHYCKTDDPEYLKKIRLLTYYGADPKITDAHGHSGFPLDVEQIRNIDFQQYFGAHGRDISSLDKI